jgi:hypothetical protein
LVPGRSASFCLARCGRTICPLLESVVSMSYRLTVRSKMQPRNPRSCLHAQLPSTIAVTLGYIQISPAMWEPMEFELFKA